MTAPIQLQHLPKRPKRRKPMKPATVRALFWVIAFVCFFTACAGVIAKCTPNPVFPL